MLIIGNMNLSYRFGLTQIFISNKFDSDLNSSKSQQTKMGTRHLSR